MERVITRDPDPRPVPSREPTQAATDFTKMALKRFVLMADSSRLQRQRSIEEVEFNSGRHWDAALRKEREEKDRVVMEVNRTPQYLNQVENAYRMARPTTIIKPNGNGADERRAEIKQGLIRNIDRRSDSESLDDECFYGLLEKGWSFSRVAVEYEHEKSNRVCLRHKRIYDDFSVYYDPGATEIDLTDAVDWFLTSDIPIDQYEATYGELPAAWSTSELKTIEDPEKEWIGEKTVRVAEYFYKLRTKEPLYTLADDPYGDGKWEDELAKDDDGRLIGVAYLEGKPIYRTSYRTKIMWCLLNGRQILEGNDELTAGREYVPGMKYVPIIPYLGRRILFEKRYIYTGMVRDAIEPCLAADYWLSAITEMVALGPKAPWIVAYDSIANYREMWDNSNIENYAALYYDRYDSDGNELPSPIRSFGEPPIQAMTFILNYAEEDLKRVMGIYQRSLGAPGPEHSGIAIRQVQQEADVANFNYTDNMKRGVELRTKIYLDLIPKVYVGAQVIDITRTDKNTEKILINKEYRDPKTGKIIDYDMVNGDYDVEVEVGQNMATRREAAAQGINDYLKVDPGAAPFVGDLLARNLDFPDKDELEERLRQRAMAAGVNVASSQADQDIPDKFKAQYQAQAKMLEQTTQALQQMQQARATEEQKFQHQANIKAMELASQERIASMNNEAKLAQAEFMSKNEAAMTYLKATVEALQNQINLMMQAPDAQEFQMSSGKLTPAGGPSPAQQPQAAM